MTLDDCTELLTPYAIAMRAQMDVPTFKAYAMVLADVPTHLAQLGLEAIAKSGARFMPGAPEIRAAAEKARRQQLALHPHEACCECQESRGWRSVLVDGVSRVQRCPCVSRHQEKLKGMELLEAISPLPGEVERESEQVFPTLAQLPAPLRQRLESIAGQKVLR